MFGGIRPLAETTVQKRKKTAIQKSGVKEIRIHDFRHSHASLLLNNGVNVLAVSKRLGHSNVNMTMRVYAHLMEKTDESMMEFLNKSSQNLLNNTTHCMETKKKPHSHAVAVSLSGEGGIRTPARFHVCWFSKPVPSASWVLLHKRFNSIAQMRFA